MVKHIVFWTFGESVADEAFQRDALEMKSRLEALNSRIPGLISLEVGIDFGLSEASADVALYSEFTDLQALKLYQEHPEHIAVADFIGGLNLDRSVVDYEVLGQ